MMKEYEVVVKATSLRHAKVIKEIIDAELHGGANIREVK